MEFHDFPFSWEWNNHPNWRSPSFCRGVGSTTNQICVVLWCYFNVGKVAFYVGASRSVVWVLLWEFLPYRSSILRPQICIMCIVMWRVMCIGKYKTIVNEAFVFHRTYSHLDHFGHMDGQSRNKLSKSQPILGQTQIPIVLNGYRSRAIW